MLAGPGPGAAGLPASDREAAKAAAAACLQTSEAPFLEALNFWKSRDCSSGFVFVSSFGLWLRDSLATWIRLFLGG